jgi:hypothetical protein
VLRTLAVGTTAGCPTPASLTRLRDQKILGPAGYLVGTWFIVRIAKGPEGPLCLRIRKDSNLRPSVP